jgi:acetoacetyl-CoA synthetase
MKQSRSVEEGDLLWTPSTQRREQARFTDFGAWLRRERGLSFADYQTMWRWSINDADAFWRAIWDYFGIMSDGGFERAVSGAAMFKARWFEGTRTNYAEHLLRYERLAAPSETAICHCSEIRPVAEMSWQELGSQVRIAATRLRAIGIEPGDRIVSYMPNTPETAVAMMATVAIGAVWSSAAPEFGSKMVIERFGQIAPKLAFLGDGYSFNGRIFDRRAEIATIAQSLPSLKYVVWFSYLGLERVMLPSGISVMGFPDLLHGRPVSAMDFRYERVAADHPLWVLFSSGTTGLPKAIVHGHAGMIAEHLKTMSLHCDLKPGKRMFFYTTTGWMMWNSVIAALITGSSCVLYDGSPMHGGVDALWRLADETRATFFGASPTLVQTMKKAGVRPGRSYPLSVLDSIIVGGAPSTPQTFQWFFENVREDLWLTSQSGGTDLCSGLLVGLPTAPVYAGELQCRSLGIATRVWNDRGEEVIDEIGELVVTAPFPSAPLFFWGDADDVRYNESYFNVFPGIWRHGDLAKINARGGGYVYGRSDSTLNRFGVRIGTAEIYRVLESMLDIFDSLVICCETPDGGFYMPLFVMLNPGLELTEEMRQAINERLRVDASPRHAPDEIHQVPAIPYTLTGKKMEVPIRKLIAGIAPEQAASRDAMADPALLDWYVDFARRPEIAARRRTAV